MGVEGGGVVFFGGDAADYERTIKVEIFGGGGGGGCETAAGLGTSESLGLKSSGGFFER